MKLIFNIILFIVSIILGILLFIPSVFHLILSFFKYKDVSRRINYYFLNSAVSIDIMLNSLFSNMLNDYFIKRGGYYFGMQGETVSSALGKNYLLGKLTTLGKGLVGVLNLIQKDHCILAVKDNEYKVLSSPNKIKISYTIIGIITFLFILFLSFKLINYII